MDDNAYMELESRTLVARNFDPEQTTKELLEELFSNFGPVKKIVLKSNLAYIEYTDKNSVGYAIAMMTGICLHGRRLNLHPKIRQSSFYKYMDSLQQFHFHCKNDKNFMDKFLSEEQKQEKSSIVDDYFKSNHKKKRIEERLRQFRKHCDPTDYNSEFNPYFGKNLMERGYKDDDRGGGYNHSNSPRTNRRHYEPPPASQSAYHHGYQPIEPPLPQIPPPIAHQPNQFYENRYTPPNQEQRISFPDSYHSNHAPPPLLPPPRPFHGHNDRYPEPFQREFNHHHHHHNHHRRHQPYPSNSGHHRQNQGWRPNYR